jgi:hypothetical protein
MAFDIRRIDAENAVVRSDLKDTIYRRYLRFFRGKSETQARPISELVIRLQLSILHHLDNLAVQTHHDLVDEILSRFLRKTFSRENHKRNDMQDMYVVLRLSLMQTFFERKGYLDLSFIDSVIRTVIRDFKNKHQTQIKQEHWAILADMCWQEIDRQSRIEPEEETDPVDIDIEDDDIDAWINSEI